MRGYRAAAEQELELQSTASCAALTPTFCLNETALWRKVTELCKPEKSLTGGLLRLQALPKNVVGLLT